MTEYIVHPLTPNRWNDLETLFGAKGATGGCWCMYWRLPRKVFNAQLGEANRLAFRSLVEQGPPPGLLAYTGEEPVGWMALAPRSMYPVLERSKILKPVDDKTVWSITCFFISKKHRRQGVSETLVKAAIDYARSQKAEILEAYPVDPRGKNYPAVFAYTGLFSTFIHAGFDEVARRSDSRPIVRYTL